MHRIALIRSNVAQLEKLEVQDSFRTVHEVAELLRVNQQTVRIWIDRGELPAVRVGQRRVRVRQSDLDRLLAAGYTGSGSTDELDDAEPEAGDDTDSSEELWTALGTALAQSSRGCG